MKTKNRHVYPKEDLILLPYKEPLKAVPESKGFGYYGTIASTKDGTKIQCHICGELKQALSFHLYYNHHVSTADYKEKFMLAKETSLVSEQMRIYRKKMMSARWANMSKKERDIQIGKIRRAVEKYRRPQPKRISLETRNKRGNCPDQMVEKVRKLSTKLGRTPTQQDYRDEYKMGQENLIIKLFGSWKNFLKRAGITTGAIRRNRIQIQHKYTNSQLLNYLRDFHKKTSQIPMRSDCQRGLLPSYGTYQLRFGGIVQAREKAGIHTGKLPTHKEYK